MPIYEFRCQKCGHRFEKLCPMGEDGKNLHCPECETENPKRIMSSFRAKSTGNDGDEGNSGGRTSSACSTCTSSNCSSCGL